MDRAMTLPVEREKEKTARISPTALIRRSGLLAAAGGAYLAVLPFVHPESPQSVAWVPVHLVYFASLAVVLLALVGIFARQIERAGRLGVAGFLTAFFGTAMTLLEGREHLFSHDFGHGTPAGLWQLMATALVFSIGYVLLGVARAGVLPRGAGILLAIGGLLVAFSPPIGVQAVITSGRNNSEIAGELFLSLKTVQNHVSNIFRKLRVADRAQAVIRAREAGLGGDLTLS